MSNVGIRPTISDGSDFHLPNCETYILDFDGDVYGQNLKVEFFKLLRQEKKFESVCDLKEQILKDAEAARAYFDSKKTE